MTADKRSVHTDALETLGTIIGDSEARDAIHLAVEPVVAAELLEPGADVGLLSDGTASATASKLVGIVDPFLKSPVAEGERFWLVVYPRQITSLRHVWEHPDFPRCAELPSASAPEAESKSWEWIKRYADSLSLHHSTLMQGADDWVASQDDSWPEYLIQGGTLEGESTSPDFWHHYQIVRGVTVPDDAQANFFSCSC
jgi:hypothetical protein